MGDAQVATLPDARTLVQGLASALCEGGEERDVTILSRLPNPFESTFPTEVVTCRLGASRVLKVLCKYELDVGSRPYGNRGGVGYEALVYEHVLRGLPLSLPSYYGMYRNPTPPGVWLILILEHVDGARRVNKAPGTQMMPRAAQWIGLFHAVQEERVRKGGPAFLIKYDADSYLGSIERTMRFLGHDVRRRLPWLEELSERLKEFLPVLLRAPLTVIHGEYYPANVLARDGAVYPVDWESAAVAAGEIDLATHIDGWGPEIAEMCRTAYAEARWPNGAPPGFERSLAAAELYLPFRWLGERAEWTQAKKAYYFERLRTIGKRLALL